MVFYIFASSQEIAIKYRTVVLRREHYQEVAALTFEPSCEPLSFDYKTDLSQTHVLGSATICSILLSNGTGREQPEAPTTPGDRLSSPSLCLTACPLCRALVLQTVKVTLVSAYWPWGDSQGREAQFWSYLGGWPPWRAGHLDPFS